MIRLCYVRSPRRLQAALLLLVMGLLAPGEWCLAAPQFPTLTGRVVDNAELLSTSERERLRRLLEAHESETTNQVVVVTLESLQGYAIDDFGYQLGRHWEIGQKGKDNGVLLIVAPTERKVRIEVGYGLEGTLTDVLSHDIIQTRIRPAFKEGNYEAGIGRGTEGILAVLGGTYQPAKPARWGSISKFMPFVLLLLVYVLAWFAGKSSTRISRYYGGHSGRYSGGGGFSGGGGGGFSGGGGSFGGGGASGGW